MGENSGKVSHIARHRFKGFQKKKEITAIIIDIALYLI